MITEPIKLIEKIVDKCPRRLATTPSEAKALNIAAEAFGDIGIQTRHDFKYNKNLYLNLAVHFGLAIFATGLASWGTIPAIIAAFIHLLVAVSYWGDTGKKFLLIRRLFPFRPSQNLLVTLPADGPVRKRLVFLAHIDAAYTGILFHPKMLKVATAEVPIKALSFTRRSMYVVTLTTFLAAFVDLGIAFTGFWPLFILLGLLTIPAFVTFVMNVDVVVRNTVVPGVADNLTGVAASVELAHRFENNKPSDVELVFVITGCEESSTGGALFLSRDMQSKWATDNTVVLGIDTLSNGDLHYAAQGEMFTTDSPQYLVDAMVSTATDVDDPIKRYVIPSGATDSLPFRVVGYDTLSLICVDPTIGAPREYHWPTDDVEHLDVPRFFKTIDYIEALAIRLGTQSN